MIQTPVPELKQDRLQPQLGALSITSYLRSVGYGATFLDLSGQEESEWKIPVADWYGFTTYSTSYHRTKKIVERCRSVNPYARMIAGGPHATALPREVAKDFEFVVTGEGEMPTEWILRGIATRRIVEGLPFANLDALPFPDFSLVNLGSYDRIVGGMPSISLQSSRGCPYSCVFCNSQIMGKGNKPRFRSPENVVKEIAFHRALGRRAFRFEDDLFALKYSWLARFTELVKEYDIIYRAFVRGDTLANPGVAELLYEGGCRHLAIGVESGSSMILDADHMNKGEPPERIKAGIRRAKDAGHIVRGYFMVGFPGESWGTIEETLDFARTMKLHEHSIYPLIIYPGTELWNNPGKFGIKILDRDFSHYFQVCGDQTAWVTYCTKDLTQDTIWKMYIHMKAEMSEISSWSGTVGEYK